MGFVERIVGTVDKLPSLMREAGALDARPYGTGAYLKAAADVTTILRLKYISWRGKRARQIIFSLEDVTHMAERAEDTEPEKNINDNDGTATSPAPEEDLSLNEVLFEE